MYESGGEWRSLNSHYQLFILKLLTAGLQIASDGLEMQQSQYK